MTTINYASEFGFRETGAELGAWMDPTDATTDLTGQGVDLTENGTLVQDIVAAGAPQMEYSGFSGLNYLEMAYNADFDVTSFTLALWVNVGTVADAETLIDRQDVGGTGARYGVRINSDGTIRSIVDDGTNQRTVDSTANLNNTGWNFVVTTWDNAGKTTIYINGVVDTIDELGISVGSLTNATALLRIGYAVTDADPCAQGLSLARVMEGELTSGGVKQLYDSEKDMFTINSQYFVYGFGVEFVFGVMMLEESSMSISKVTDSIGGTRQIIFNREDKYWDVRSTEVTDADVVGFQNFLSSVMRGQIFTIDPYDLGEPVDCIIDSNSYSAARVGTTNYFTFSFKVKEI
jgi:hypothetical protein